MDHAGEAGPKDIASRRKLPVERRCDDGDREFKRLELDAEREHCAEARVKVGAETAHFTQLATHGSKAQSTVGLAIGPEVLQRPEGSRGTSQEGSAVLMDI